MKFLHDIVSRVGPTRWRREPDPTSPPPTLPAARPPAGPPRAHAYRLTLGLATVALLGGGAWFCRSEWQQMRQAAEDQLQAVAALKVRELSKWRSDQLGEAAELTDNPFLSAQIERWLARRSPADAAEILDRFRGLERHYGYAEVTLVNPAGEPLLALHGRSAPLRADDQRTLQAALAAGRPGLGNLHRHEPTGTPQLSVVAPIVCGGSTDGAPLGAVVLQLEARRLLYPLIQTWPTPSPSAETLIFWRDGDAVLFLNDFRHRTGAALTARLPLSSAHAPSVAAVLGREGVFHGEDYRGVAVLSYIQAVPDSPWLMVVKVDAAEVFAEWRGRVALLAGLVLVVAILMAALHLLRHARERNTHWRTLYEQEAARRSQEHLASIIQSVQGVVWELDLATFRFTYVSPQAEALLGYPVAQWAEAGFWVDHLHPDDREHAVLFCTEQTKAGRDHAFEYRLRAADGRWVWLRDIVSVVLKDGHPTKLRGIMMDFTATKEAGAELALHARRAQALMHLPVLAETLPEEVFLQRGLEQAEDLTDSQIAFLHVVTDDEPALELVAWSRRTVDGACHAHHERHDFAAQAGIWADALRTRQPVVCNDYAGHPHKRDLPAGHAELIRLISVPVIENGRVVMIAGVGNKATDYSPTDVETLQLVASNVWRLVQRGRGAQLLEDNNRIYQGILATTLDGFWLVQADDGRILDVNATYCRLSGHAREELIGRRIGDIDAQATPDELAARLREIAAAGSTRFESRHRRKDGTVWEVEISATSLGPGTGRFCVFLRDLGARNAARREAEQAARELQASEAQLRIVTDHAPVFLARCDRERRYRFVNRHYADLQGRQPAELVGRTIQETLGETHYARLRPQLDAVLAGNAVEFDFERPTERTGPRVVHAHYVPERDATGAVTGFVAVFVDITEQRKALVRLLLLDAALQAVSAGITISSHLGAIEWVNPGFCRMTGYTPPEIVGANHRLLKSGRQSAAFYAELWRTIGSGAVWTGELVNRRKDGTEYQERMMIAPFAQTGHDITHYIAIKQDITEQKLLERQFLRAQRMEGIGLLAGGIAHDLNNVLTPILLSVDLLRHASDDEAKVTIDIIESSARRGAGVVRQVLTFARGMEGDHVPLRPADLVRELAHMVEETFPRDLTIRRAVADDLPAVQGDATQLHQVLLNLAVNARDAMPGGGTLTLGAASELVARPRPAALADIPPGDYVVLTVTDTGDGIPAELHEKIFDPFFTTKPLGKGTGLGLPTVHGIVRSHHGFIEVRSSAGAGAEFRVYLPAVAAGATPPAAGTRAPLEGAGRTLLICDDEELIRQLTRVILTQHGFKVLEAADGREGLAVFRAHQPEIAVAMLDIMMPQMPGDLLAEELHRLAPALPVVLMSGLMNDGMERVNRAGAAGPTTLMRKPFTQDELLQTLAKLLAHR